MGLVSLGLGIAVHYDGYDSGRPAVDRVSHTDRGESIRIIGAREASRRERKDYEDGNFP